LLLSCSKDGNILLWNTLKREVIQTFRDSKSTEGSEPLSIKVHPSNVYFASGHSDTYLRIWNLEADPSSVQKEIAFFTQPKKKF